MSTCITKRSKKIAEIISDTQKVYETNEAIELLKKASSVKFTESFDIAVNLGIDAKKSDQNVRGSAVLPHGTGKTVRVACFAQDEKAKAAKEAGADIVGWEDLAEQIKKGQMDFDVLIASPDSMRLVGQLGQILGPKGLMPNPKVGTVAADVAQAVKNAKGGQVRYRNDKNGIVHARIGNVSFDANAIKENIEFFVSALKKAKPASAKGIYFKKISISTTMGPALTIDMGKVL